MDNVEILKQIKESVLNEYIQYKVNMVSRRASDVFDKAHEVYFYIELYSFIQDLDEYKLSETAEALVDMFYDKLHECVVDKILDKLLDSYNDLENVSISSWRDKEEFISNVYYYSE